MRPQPRYRPGDKIGGRYQVYQALSGGMGDVYLCIDWEEMYPIALKTFQERYQTNPKLRAAFENEVTTWVALEKHPNIVRCFFMDTLDNRPFMKLEWIEGEEGRGADLRGWLRRGPLELRTALDFCIDICRGLIHAQEKQPGLVHRDLKPENIMVAEGRLAKITDFGLAQVVQAAELVIAGGESEAIGRQSLVGQGDVVGTPPYMAPEQWRNQDLDVRTDIYAVGCILYEMLIGSWPFQSTTLDGLRHKHMEANIPKLADNQNLPASLNELLINCLAKRREERFATAGDLLQQIILVYKQRFSQLTRDITASDEFTALDFNNRGITYYKLKRYNEALADLTRAVRLHPCYANAHTNRGNVYYGLRQYDKALADHTQATHLDPALMMAHTNRGNTYTQLQQYDNALVDHGQAIQLDSSNAIPYNNRGNTYTELRRYHEALAEFDHAIQLDPVLAGAYINRGRVYDSLGRVDEALADFSHAVRLDPGLAEAHKSLGTFFIKRCKLQEALPHFENAGQFGDSQAAQTAVEIRELYSKPVSQVDAQLSAAAFTFHLTDSTDELRSLARRFPSMMDPRHIAVLEKTAQKTTSDLRIGFEQRLNWLREIATEYYNLRGSNYSSSYKFTEALTNFNRAIQIDPGYVLAYIGRGEAYYGLQDYAKALADFSRAISLDPTLTRAYVGRGTTYADLKQHDDALADLDRAVGLNPDVAQIYYNRSRVYEAFQQYDNALTDLNQAIQLEPTLAQAYVNRGCIFQELKRYDDTIEDFNQAIELDSALHKAYYNRGLAYANLQQDEKALADLDQAARLDSGDAKIYYNRGLVYKNLQQDKNALDDFGQAIQLDPTWVEPYIIRGSTYTDLQHYDKALADFNQAIELDPSAAMAYVGRGDAYEGIGYPPNKALSDYFQATQIDPTLVPAYLSRGTTYAHLGQYDEAIREFNHAIQLAPELTEAYYNRGNIHLGLQEYHEALADFNKAIEIDPSFAFAHYNIGVVFIKSGQLREALPYLEKATELGYSEAEEVASRIRLQLSTAPTYYSVVVNSIICGPVEIRLKLGTAPLSPADLLPPELVHLAYDSFTDSDTSEDMYQAVAQYPFIVNRGFIESIEQIITQRVPPEIRPGFERRLAWLLQIADQRVV